MILDAVCFINDAIRRSRVDREVIVSDLNNKCPMEIASDLIETLPRHSHILLCADVCDLKAMLRHFIVGLQYSPYALSFAAPTRFACDALSKHIDRILNDGDCPEATHCTVSTFSDLEQLQTSTSPAPQSLCAAWLTPQTFRDYTADALFHALNCRSYNRVVFLWGYGSPESLAVASNNALYRLYDDLRLLHYNTQTPTFRHIAIDYIGHANDIGATHAPFPSDDFWNKMKRSTPYIYADDRETLRLLAHAASVHHFPAIQLDEIDEKSGAAKKAKSYLTPSIEWDFSTFAEKAHPIVGIDAFDESTLDLLRHVSLNRSGISRSRKSATSNSDAEVYLLCQSEFSLLRTTAHFGENRSHGERRDRPSDELPFVAWTIFKTLSQLHQTDYSLLLNRVTDIVKLSTEPDGLSTISPDLSTDLWNNPADLPTSDGKLSTESASLSTDSVPLSPSCEAPHQSEPSGILPSRARAILKSLLSDWRDRKLITIEPTFDSRIATIAIRPEAKKCFAGVADLNAIAPLCQYCHKADVITPNRELVTRVDLSFLTLDASAIFQTQQGIYRKYIHPSPDTLLVQPAQSFTFPMWLDALPGELTFEEARNIESLMRIPTSALENAKLCDAGLNKYREIIARFAPFYQRVDKNKTLAVSCRSSLDLWTFAGARHHALLAVILRALLSKYGVEIGYGNLGLHLRWDPKTQDHSEITKITCNLMRSLASMSYDDLPDIVLETLRMKFDKFHPMGWVAQILPQTWISKMIRNAFEATQKCALDRYARAFFVDEENDEVCMLHRSNDDAFDDIDAKCDVAYVDTDWHAQDVTLKATNTASSNYSAAHLHANEALESLLHNSESTSSPQCHSNRSTPNDEHSSAICPPHSRATRSNAKASSRQMRKTKTLREATMNDDFSHIAIRSETCPWHADDDCLRTTLPWYYIDNTRDFNRALDVILTQSYIGLDVETTLYDRSLRLVQIGCLSQTFLIDPLSVNIAQLSQVMSHPGITKIIHNAAFEKSVLAQHNIQIAPIVDTMTLSRSIFGLKVAGGHKLTSLCERVFGRGLRKECQTSNWSARPLSPMQLEYAALDAEILVRLYPRLTRTRLPLVD